MSAYPVRARLRIWVGLILTIVATIILSRLMESWLAGILITVPAGLALTVRWARSAIKNQ